MHLIVTSGRDGREHLRMHCAVAVTSSLQIGDPTIPYPPTTKIHYLLLEKQPSRRLPHFLRHATAPVSLDFQAASKFLRLISHTTNCWRRQHLRPPLNTIRCGGHRTNAKTHFAHLELRRRRSSRPHAVHQKSRETDKYLSELITCIISGTMQQP